MELLTVVLLFVFFVCILLYFRKGASHNNTSPQKPGLPVFGNVFNWTPTSTRYLTDELSLGDIFHLKLGPIVFIRLNSYRAVHEALVSHSDAFNGRMKGEMLTRLFHDAGVLNNDGPVWQEHRRLMLRLLRDFGVGKPLVNEIVADEASCLVGRLLAREGAPVVTQEEFSTLTSNVIARLIFGARYGTDDAGFKQFMDDLSETFDFKPVNAIGLMFPWIFKVSILRRIFEHFAVMIFYMHKTQDYIRQKIEKQRQMLQEMDPVPTEVDQATNLCEAFLIEKANQEAVNPTTHSFSDWQVIMNMSDLFQAGTETTASTFNWAMLLLATHPHVQARLHAEINDKIGCERSPTLADRQELPYVCATMDEVMRYSSLLPLNAGRRCTEDTEVLGYIIPEGAIITTNLHGIHHDPKNWARPEDFYPEHFLSNEGSYQPSKFLMPFSMGKRACLGESLARTEFFLVFVSILQKFRVKVADPKMDVKKTLEGKMRIVRRPLEHEIVFDKLATD